MDRRLTSSDGDWIRQAVRRYESRLLTYALHLLHDRERARDVVQETFLKLCTQQPDRIQSHLAEWLFTVCRNACVDIQRKESRMRPLDVTAAGNEQTDVPSPADRLEQTESTSTVLRMLGGLPPNQQEVIRLKFQHGLSYQQISNVTGLSVTNVGFLLHTGIKTVRTRIESQDVAGQGTASGLITS